MNKTNTSDGSPEDTRTVPPGYREGTVTAIALFLGLSIAFLRFWSFEAPGSWTPASTSAAILTGAGLVLQLIALFRALDVRDHVVAHYRVTVRFFFAGIVVVIVGATLSAIVLHIESG